MTKATLSQEVLMKNVNVLTKHLDNRGRTTNNILVFRIVEYPLLSYFRNPAVFWHRSVFVTFTTVFFVALSGCQALKAPVLTCKGFDPACLRRCLVQVGMSKDQVRALLLVRPERDSRPPGALGLEEFWEWYWGYVSFGRDGRVEYTNVHWGSCPTEKSD